MSNEQGKLHANEESNEDHSVSNDLPTQHQQNCQKPNQPGNSQRLRRSEQYFNGEKGSERDGLEPHRHEHNAMSFGANSQGPNQPENSQASRGNEAWQNSGVEKSWGSQRHGNNAHQRYQQNWSGFFFSGPPRPPPVKNVNGGRETHQIVPPILVPQQMPLDPRHVVDTVLRLPIIRAEFEANTIAFENLAQQYIERVCVPLGFAPQRSPSVATSVSQAESGYEEAPFDERYMEQVTSETGTHGIMRIDDNCSRIFHQCGPIFTVSNTNIKTAIDLTYYRILQDNENKQLGLEKQPVAHVSHEQFASTSDSLSDIASSDVASHETALTVDQDPDASVEVNSAEAVSQEEVVTQEEADPQKEIDPQEKVISQEEFIVSVSAPSVLDGTVDDKVSASAPVMSAVQTRKQKAEAKKAEEELRRAEKKKERDRENQRKGEEKKKAMDDKKAQKEQKQLERDAKNREKQAAQEDRRAQEKEVEKATKKQKEQKRNQLKQRKQRHEEKMLKKADKKKAQEKKDKEETEELEAATRYNAEKWALFEKINAKAQKGQSSRPRSKTPPEPAPRRVNGAGASFLAQERQFEGSVEVAEGYQDPQIARDVGENQPIPHPNSIALLDGKVVPETLEEFETVDDDEIIKNSTDNGGH